MIRNVGSQTQDFRVNGANSTSLLFLPPESNNRYKFNKFWPSVGLNALLLTSSAASPVLPRHQKFCLHKKFVSTGRRHSGFLENRKLNFWSGVEKLFSVLQFKCKFLTENAELRIQFMLWKNKFDVQKLLKIWSRVHLLKLCFVKMFDYLRSEWAVVVVKWLERRTRNQMLQSSNPPCTRAFFSSSINCRVLASPGSAGM